MPDLNDTAGLLKMMGDPTRVRLLSLLGREELTVAELTHATRLPQSRVSTHLGRLREAGLVRDRRSGASCFYALNEAGMSMEARSLWELLREGTRDPLLEEDGQRASALISRRRESWADSVAGQMERHYSPGRSWETALCGLLGFVQLGDVLDVASGDGALAELIAPRARSVTCLDLSPKVVAAARRRLKDLPCVQFQVGDMQSLEFPTGSFDQLLLMHALSYAEDPQGVVAEAARVLRPGGTLVGVTLRTHRHRSVAESYNHRQMGFEPEALSRLLVDAGFEVGLCDVTSREKRPPHFEVITLHAALDTGGHG
jgi:SAM-dependent methyltransferase